MVSVRAGIRLRSKIGTGEAADVDMHANQLTVSLETVRELVDEQFPEWRMLPITGVASQGTVNAIFPHWRPVSSSVPAGTQGRRVDATVAGVGGERSPRTGGPHPVRHT
jgi:hypothetical protein